MKISGSSCLVNYCRNATTVVGNAVAGGAISATGDLVGSSVICVVVGIDPMRDSIPSGIGNPIGYGSKTET